MKLWHERLPNQYQAIENFNHGWVGKLPHPRGCKTLEIGAGLGGHMAFETLSDQDYYGLELRPLFCEQLAKKMDPAHVICGDIQKGTNLEKNSWDRIIAIHTLEHLIDLPAALEEILRLLKPSGVFDVVLPCDGGFLYSLARRISSQRLFEKTFRMSFKPIIDNEHVSHLPEISTALEDRFTIDRYRYFPFFVPIYQVNLCLGLRLAPRHPA